LDKFKIFKTEVENQHDLKIKIVRSDRLGSTMVGTPQVPYLKQTPGEPQQNGVAERRNHIHHFRVWGCPAEAKVFNPNIGKLDPKTVSCHFIGYPEKFIEISLLLSRQTHKVYRNKTRCLLRRSNDQGDHGSQKN